MSRQYFDFLKSWQSEKKISSFFGSDKPDFLADWKYVKAGGKLKQKLPEIILQPMEEALPTVSEKKTGLRIEMKERPRQNEPVDLFARKKGDPVRKASAYSYASNEGVKGEDFNANRLRGILRDYVKMTEGRVMTNSQLLKMKKGEVLDAFIDLNISPEKALLKINKK